ncbi:MAG TPA: acyltransferase family protein [Clostridia bacterium]|nr:acyltransferase family protein [Clostridia bacterium]
MNTTAVPVGPVGTEPSGKALHSESGTRYHHLDAVRAFALLLGVFFHAAESFGSRNNYWAIVDCSPSNFLEAVRFACHSFRLELFFVIAGFFARLLLVRRGTTTFISNRTQRILVPLVVGWILLYPLLVAIWIWGASVSGRLPEFGVPAEAVQLPVWKLTLGFFLTGGFLQKFDLTHLWFLHQLLVVYVVALGIRWIVVHLDTSGGMMRRADKWFDRIVTGPGTFYCFLLPSIPILLTMNSWGVDTPKESLTPHLPTTLLFGYFFLTGWLWHRQPRLLDNIARWWPWYMAIGVLAWFGFGLAEGKVQWTRPLFTLLYAHMMWGLVLGFIGLFTRFCQRANAWTRYVADSSYWIYIAHLPLVVAFQVLIGRVALPWPVKYISLCAVALVLLFLSYHYLVRGTFIGVLLNGHRYPRVWPWHKQ